MKTFKPAFVLSAVLLMACSPDPVSQTPKIALSAHGEEQAESIARDMLASTYPQGELNAVGNCIRAVSSAAQLLAIIEAARDQARATLQSIHASDPARDCIAANNVTWRDPV